MTLPPKSVVMRIFYAKTIYVNFGEKYAKLYNMSFIDFEVVLIVMYLMICN